MCLAIPGKVIEIKEKTCIVDIMGVSTEASIQLLKKVCVGDYLLIHAGCAIEKINEEEAIKTLNLFKELKEIMND